MPMYRGYVLVCQVAGLIPALLVCASLQSECAGKDPCLGNRPPLPNGCCSAGAGHECNPLDGYLCDRDLGFSCVDKEGNLVVNETGECKGRYNLRVVDRDQTSLTVEWTVFAPESYEEEYVLLIRTHTYHDDVNKWESMDIGFDPRYTIHNLSPATLYLIQVAIWRDVRPWALGKTSETIMVKTKDAEFCDVEEIGRRFKVGEIFESEEEDSCVCRPSGEPECVRLSNETETGMPEFPEGPALKFGNESCEVDNTTYPHDFELEQGCKTCTCLDGNWECTYPYYCIEPPPKGCLHPRTIDIEGECCPEWQCDNQCVYENKTYSVGEFYINSNCSLCQCNPTVEEQCVTDCPPVEMVPKDIICPDPHIRETGCCPTLHCWDPQMSGFDMMQNMYAFSREPDKVTVSFEVEPVSEDQGVPVYCQYEILYSNQSNSPDAWKKQIVQPIDVQILSTKSVAKGPYDVLIHDAAIVVDERAYVTLSEMHPNTIYYVNIEKLDGNLENMADVLWSKRNFTVKSAMIVVETKPLAYMNSCLLDGRSIPHGYIVTSDCSQKCQCQMGKIHCEDTCSDSQAVIIHSKSCPHPRLEKVDGECCPQWRCFPSELGCTHENVILNPGQSVTDGCKECTCLNSTMECVSLCPSKSSTPRPGCILINVSGLCCPQWSCPRKEQPPNGVQRSVLMILFRTCSDPVTNFKTDLISHFHDYIKHLVDCSEDSIETYHICHSLKFEVNCFGRSSNIVRRYKKSLYDPDKSNVTELIVTMERNFSSSVDESIIQDVDMAILKLRELLNTTFDLTLTDGTVIQPTKHIHLQNLKYICNTGFSYVNGKCVPSEVEFDKSFKIHADLSIVKVSSESTLVQWQPLRKSLHFQLDHFVIRFKVNGSMKWSSTETFQPWITAWVLKPLNPDTVYIAKLMAFTRSNPQNKWNLGDLTFQTLSYSGTIPERLTINKLYTSETSVTLVLDPLPEEIVNHIKSIYVIYGTSGSDKKHKKVVVHSQPLVSLTDLSPGTQYTLEVKVLLSSGETIQSGKFDWTSNFLTGQKSNNNLLIPLIPFVIACVITAASIMFVCIFFIWRQNTNKGGNKGLGDKPYIGAQLEHSPDLCIDVNPSSI